MGPDPTWHVFLLKRGPWDTHTEGWPWEETEEKASPSQGERPGPASPSQPSGGTSLASILILDIKLPGCEIVTFHCLSHLDCGTLLWQPHNLTHTHTI